VIVALNGEGDESTVYILWMAHQAVPYAELGIVNSQSWNFNNVSTIIAYATALINFFWANALDIANSISRKHGC